MELIKPEELKTITFQLTHGLINYEKACEEISKITGVRMAAGFKLIADETPNNQKLGEKIRKMTRL